ncbi:MAG: DUF3604 domain-containing protein [Planctomycetes bacterium]|nr:DUF3604 domain-containing protein [Planctomycetota bacterium]
MSIRPSRDLVSLWLLALTVCTACPVQTRSASGEDRGALAHVLQNAPPDLVVNGEGKSYDSEPSLAVLPDGGAWMAWHAYYRGRDRVFLRRLGSEGPGPVEVVSDEGTVHGGPVAVAGPKGSVWVFWAARLEGRSQILARRMGDGQRGPITALSNPSIDAVFPAAARVDEDRMLVSWCAHEKGRFRIFCRAFRHGVWQPPAPVSDPERDAFRSAVVAAGKRDAWIVWDSCQGGRYAVWARPLEPALGPAVRISPEGRNCLVPVALAAAAGLHVAWLEVEDVIGGEGAITQWHTLHVAAHRPDGWRLLRDSNGSSAAATLTHGLIARMEPEPVATGGYMGRRRHPLLLEEGGAIWLVWERKAEHRASTPVAAGELIGRRFQGGRWRQPVVLHQGYVDYHLAHPPEAHQGKFLFVASDLPRNGRRIYHRVVGDLHEFTEFHQDDWPGWQPVKLPFSDEPGRRHKIRLGDRTFRLYWGDLHCHSGLTADAEGEPDELLHYARDRARLDVVVMTQNDHIYDTFLTEEEYALDHFFAGAFTRPGRFLVLPGYEWTSRLPKTPDVPRADPANWTFPYSRGSYPNHRTVIYPPAGGPAVRHPEVKNDIGKLNDAVLAGGGLTLTQHATWDLTGHPVEVGVEVSTGWGIYIKNPARVHRALDDGFRFGLVACGDSHRRNPGLCGGLTGIYAEELTAEAILDAIKNRRVFATNGSRIAVDSRANGTFMGQDLRADDGKVEITLSVVGTRPIVQATLIRDGEEVKTFDGDGNVRLSVEHQDTLDPGVHWYYWRIAQEGASPRYPGNVKVARGHLAWSSPHWVTVE